MKMLWLIYVVLLINALLGQTAIKWQETFDSPDIPDGWQTIDADGSGTGLSLVQETETPYGTSITPETGQSFWTSNVQNANLAGVIDEWLISPRISVIYAPDSLYFWAGAVDDLFDDSLKVKISTTGNNPASFIHELAYFKVDGPAGEWHRYGFSLADFDSSDIYIAINYYIRDGGPGGQHSDFIWLDNIYITGDPATRNNPPSDFVLRQPTDHSIVNITSETVNFAWSASQDRDGEDLSYKLTILNVFPPLHYIGLTDSVFSLAWKDVLLDNFEYRWTVEVTDGKSTVAAADTFSFELADPASITDISRNIPGNPELMQNFPNPFNPMTTIAWQISKPGHVELTIYNVRGQLISTLISKQLAAGRYEVEWQPENLSSGVYLYRLRTDQWQEVKKMLLVR